MCKMLGRSLATPGQEVSVKRKGLVRLYPIIVWCRANRWKLAIDHIFWPHGYTSEKSPIPALFR